MERPTVITSVKISWHYWTKNTVTSFFEATPLTAIWL